MRDTGKLVHWDDERGFGFIETADRSRVFVHVTAIARMANRPRVGDILTFDTSSGRDGRPEARNVRVAGANPAGTRRVSRGGANSDARLDWRLPAAGLLLALAILAAGLGRAPVYLLAAYLGMGLISLFLYRSDKTYAQSGSWRISEVMLLGVDLAFGIIGGLLAQGAFRHKTRKGEYVGATILLTLVHLAWLGGMSTGLISWDEIVELPALLLGGEV